MKIIFTLLIVFSNSLIAWSQSTWNPSQALIGKDGQPANFYDVQKAFYENEKANPYDRENSSNEFEEESGNRGWLQFGRWEEFMEPRVYPTGDLTLPRQAAENYKRYLDSLSHGFIFRKTSSPNIISSAAGNWHSLGPAYISSLGNTTPVNGRIDFVTFYPNNSNTMFVGSNTGGLWKSINGGTSWANLTDNLPFIGCYDLAISNSNPDKMYLATGTIGGPGYAYDVGVLKSMDGGITWNATGIVLPANGFGEVHKLAIHPSNDEVVLAATFNGVYKTSDGGTIWTQVQTGSFIDITFKPGDPTIAYATQEGFTTTRFYRSVNTGDTFTQITTGLQAPSAAADAVAFKIGVTPANPDIVYLVASDQSSMGFGGIYRSVDGGLTFNTQADSSGFIRILYDPSFMCITVNPTNADELFIGGFAPYRSTDGGVTWAGSGGYLYVDLHDLEFLPGSSNTIFAACDGGFSKSVANGANWSYLSNGLQVLQIYKIANSTTNPNKVMTGQQDVGIHLYNAGVWENIYQIDGMECFFDPIDTNVIYISKQQGGILKSTDGGVNFNYIVTTFGTGLNSVGNWVSPFVRHPSDPNTFLIGKDSIYRTTNGGTSWSAMQNSYSQFTKYKAIAYAPSNPQYIYAATTGKFYACTNGTDFTLRVYAFPGSISSITVSNINPEKVWVSLSGYSSGNKVYASTDAGVTWSDYSTGLPNLPVNCIIYQNNTNDRLFVGMDVGVYYRSDSLPAWENFSTGMPNVQVRDLEIEYTTSVIRAGTYGRGLWESDLNLTTGIDGVSSPNNVFTIYPNPASDRFFIRLNNDLLKNQMVTMELFNSIGELVYSQKLHSEISEININLSPGLYVVNLNDGVEISRRKIVVR